ncbi:MAG: UDP-2,4-diacetamido-2,4,6-trideoxy-beta-L-altropyranose hydrolase, partial [Tissierellia bacterium]|nr:UDP-2,4-diacetamido-2,4,6-trideoxy-beta-L-altropyranose hydrolase [Tissierellia bacterium]
MLENYKYNNVKFYMNVKNMKNLMINNDLAISAGGNTLYELCACGIPTIAIIIADNQLKFV